MISVEIDDSLLAVDATGAVARLQAALDGRAPTPGAVKLRYMTMADSRVRPEHAALHGTLWEYDDPVRPVPPYGYGCRCWVETVTTEDDGTGLPVVTDAPRPGADALQRFSDTADVPLSAILGQRVAALVDSGDVELSALVSSEGTFVGATIAEALAVSGMRRAAVEATFRLLASLGIRAAQQAAAVRLAAGRSGDATTRLTRALLEIAPGSIGTASRAATAQRRAHRAAVAILRLRGGTL